MASTPVRLPHSFVVDYWPLYVCVLDTKEVIRRSRQVANGVSVVAESIGLYMGNGDAHTFNVPA